VSDLPKQVRAFVAVSIPECIRERLATVQQELKGEFTDVSWTRPEAMHITLQFLGNIPSARLPELQVALRQCAGPITSFEAEVSGLGSFNDRVLWAGITCGAQQFGELAGAVRGSAKVLAAHEEERAFNAHVTLGRFRQRGRGVSKVLRSIPSPQFGEWQVSHFELIRSELSPHGAKYTVLESFPLKPRES
jgi:2'-5' RNA ligase